MKSKEKTVKKTSIGGQAVIEGIMMKSATSMATAVRDEDGIIRVESKRTKGKKPSVMKWPLIRGVVAFVNSLVGGMTTLMRSAEVFGESEPSKFEKWTAEKLKVNVMSVVLGFSLIVGLALAVLLFIFLPQLAREGIEMLVGNGFTFDIWAKNFIEGGLKLLIFLGYLFLCMLIKDVKRTFMYHGAEHKTITCYEKGLDLTVENARSCKRVHDRCGTTFIVFVLVISIIMFALFEAVVGQSITGVLRVLCKIALLPVVAGLSYELLRGLSKTDCVIFYPLKVPGMLLQKITTKEPTDDMLEVAITAFKTVMELDANPEMQEQKFIVPEKASELVERVYQKLKEHGIEERAEAEWIVSLKSGLKRDELTEEKTIRPKFIEQINLVVEERIKGRPLWYCIGDTEFYGYTIKVDERVLIPRPETELLAENVIKIANGKTVLDLCTGSGAIAIAIKKECATVSVTALDVSADALVLASENAKLNEAEIEFIHSDMFTALEESGRKFDVIVSNPPYIKSEDISSLQKEVKDFEPVLALDGGVDGYDFYKIIAEKVKNHLTEKGVLLMECGIGQAEEICKMLQGFSKVEIIKDYENIDRIIKAEI